MNIIDSVDKQIVQLLGEDARQNSKTLAKKLNLSAATVRRRLRKLIHSDLLRIVGVVDPASFGFPLIVIIILDVAHDKAELAMEELSKRREVRFVSTITGRSDIIALAWFPSHDVLCDFLTKELGQIEGVRDSETLICFDVKKGRYASLTDYGLDA